MALCCGCDFYAGAPVSAETLRAHYKHTIEVLLLWELIGRKTSTTPADKLKLSQARLDVLNAIQSLYPEVNE